LSQPQLAGVMLSVESLQRIAGLAHRVEPRLRGATVEASLCLHAKATSSSPASWDIKLMTPSHTRKCFAGGRKVSGVLRRWSRRAWRAKDLTAMPPKVVSRRCHDDHKSKVAKPASTSVSISLGHCKVVSQRNGLDYPPDCVLYWWGRWLWVFKAL
jgi:hypothetical protein